MHGLPLLCLCRMHGVLFCLFVGVSVRLSVYLWNCFIRLTPEALFVEVTETAYRRMQRHSNPFLTQVLPSSIRRLPTPRLADGFHPADDRRRLAAPGRESVCLLSTGICAVVNVGRTHVRQTDETNLNGTNHPNRLTRRRVTLSTSLNTAGVGLRDDSRKIHIRLYTSYFPRLPKLVRNLVTRRQSGDREDHVTT